MLGTLFRKEGQAGCCSSAGSIPRRSDRSEQRALCRAVLKWKVGESGVCGENTVRQILEDEAGGDE